MLERLVRGLSIFAALSLLVLLAAGGAAGQHDPASTDHLLTPETPTGLPQRADGTWGKLSLVSSLRVHDAEPDLIADVTVFGNYAYLARWGGSDCAGPESGGQKSPDGGVYVIDISNLAQPREVGFIAAHQDTLVGEGMQVIHVDTPQFTGDVLAVNHEQCGKNGKAGFSLYDVTNPLKPRKLTENFGDFTADGDRNRPHDANQYHSVFIWDAGDRAYLVASDDDESSDVDIYDITDPKKPTLISELDFNDNAISQPELGLTDSFLHDMVVKKIGDRYIMLASYWDGGYVLVDVTNPAQPVVLGDSQFAPVDPELLAQTGVSLTPEGNAHQGEFTADNRFVIATDEDFDPYRLVVTTEDGKFTAKAGTQTTNDEAVAIGGTTVFVGRACDGDPAVPTAPATGTSQTAVVERGLCTFEEKAQNVLEAGGYEALIIFNREGDDACTGVLSPSLTADIPTIFIGRDAGFAMFDKPYDQAACADATPEQSGIAIGTIGDPVLDVDSIFDGWGYVHLFAPSIGATSATLTDLDTYAIPEAMDPAFATGYGDLSVHEVATDPQDASLAYLSYYGGGIRAVQIQCSNPADTSTCKLAEVGGFIDPDTDGAGPDRGGNDFWGIETQVRDGVTYVFGSDRDSGLYILRDP